MDRNPFPSQSGPPPSVRPPSPLHPDAIEYQFFRKSAFLVLPLPQLALDVSRCQNCPELQTALAELVVLIRARFDLVLFAIVMC